MHVYLATGAMKPGGCLERSFGKSVRTPDPNEPRGAAFRITDDFAWFPLASSHAEALFLCLREDRLCLFDELGRLVIAPVPSR